MTSPTAGPRLVKRSFSFQGHATSVALEPDFWLALEEMAAERSLSLSALLQELDQLRGGAPLASSARVAALSWARAKGPLT